MKVYVLNMEYRYGTSNGTECVGVYDTEEKAQKAMENEIEKEREEVKKLDELNAPNGASIIIGKGESAISTGWAHKYYTIIGKEVK